MTINETYTERLFNGSLEEIRELHNNGATISEIADK
jgi:hypothetical protein